MYGFGHTLLFMRLPTHLVTGGFCFHTASRGSGSRANYHTAVLRPHFPLQGNTYSAQLDRDLEVSS